LRIDKLQIEMPAPTEPGPKAAAAVQELLGGRFGEMSTLVNYMYQSFNFRDRDNLRRYYSLIANIATEELGHIELVAAFD
jgi:Mn-containing catalase